MNCLLRIVPHAVRAALGGERQALDAGVGELEHEAGRQVVEAQRGDRDLVVHRRQVVDDAVDLRVVADRGRDEADAGSWPGAPRALGPRAPAAREAAHRKVVVARPAEAAHAGAAARDLDHVLHRHLGVGRQHDRLGEAHLARPAALADDAAGAVVGGHRAVRVVAHLVARRHVEAVLRAARASRPRRGSLAPRSASIIRGTIGSPSPTATRSANGRERLGVQQHRRAAQDHDRVARARGRSPATGCRPGAAPAARAGSRSRTRPRRRSRRSRAAASRSRSSPEGCRCARARPCPRRRAGRRARRRRPGRAFSSR